MAKKKWQANHPRTGKWENAELVQAPHKTGLTQADKQNVVTLKFKDDTIAETPLWATNYDD